MIRSRVKTFAWRLLRRALGTAKWIQRINPNVNETCLHCTKIEDEKHVSFECSFVRVILFGSTLGLRSTSLPSLGHGLYPQVTTILQQCSLQAMTSLVFQLCGAYRNLEMITGSTTPIGKLQGCFVKRILLIEVITVLWKKTQRPLMSLMKLITILCLLIYTNFSGSLHAREGTKIFYDASISYSALKHALASSFSLLLYYLYPTKR